MPSTVKMENNVKIFKPRETAFPASSEVLSHEPADLEQQYISRLHFTIPCYHVRTEYKLINSF